MQRKSFSVSSKNLIGEGKEVVERQDGYISLLRLEMLLAVLHTHQQTCVLWATIPAATLPAAGMRFGKGKIPVPCQAELVVVQGRVSTCLIRASQSRQVILEGKSALDCLEHCGELCWMVQPEQPIHPSHFWGSCSQDGWHAGLSPPPPTPYERWAEKPPPRIAVHLDSKQVENLPQVLLLVNGQRGIDDVRRMLNCSFEQLSAVLDDLEARHLITFSGPSDGRERTW
jgi:hypothetical protein